MQHAQHAAEFVAFDADIDEFGRLPAGGLVRDDVSRFVHDLEIGNPHWQGKLSSYYICG